MTYDPFLHIDLLNEISELKLELDSLIDSIEEEKNKRIQNNLVTAFHNVFRDFLDAEERLNKITNENSY